MEGMGECQTLYFPPGGKTSLQMICASYPRNTEPREVMRCFAYDDGRLSELGLKDLLDAIGKYRHYVMTMKLTTPKIKPFSEFYAEYEVWLEGDSVA